MNRLKFFDLWDEFIKNCKRILVSRNTERATEDDPLYNIKRCAYNKNKCPELDVAEFIMEKATRILTAVEHGRWHEARMEIPDMVNYGYIEDVLLSQKEKQ